MANGIDVSEWQGRIDWNILRTDFAIIRAGYGRSSLQKDKYFDYNYNGCKSAKIPCGAYWFSYAMSADDAITEARACLEVIKGKNFEYPIYYDVEDERILSKGKAAVSGIIRAFLDTLEKSGYFVGLYMSADILERYVESDIKNKYSVWVADYSYPIDYSGKYGMWQKSAEGKIDGIDGNVDLDVSYENFPDIIKSAGLNGFGKSHTITVIIDGKTVIDNYYF